MAASTDSSTIQTTLSAVGVPTIDTSFFSMQHTQELRKKQSQNPSRTILHALDRLGKVSNTRISSASGVRTPRLDWSRTNPDARNHLVTYFAAKAPRDGYTNAELQSLRKLPVFQTLSGDFTSLNVLTSSSGETKVSGAGQKTPEYYYLKRADTTLPDMLSGTSRILKRKQGAESKLYNELGVTELREIDLFQKFIVPEFDGLSRLDKSRFTEQLCSQWSTLRKQTSLVDTLKDLEFIPVVNEDRHARPCDLLDPRNQMLSTLFQHRPDMFPKGEYASKRWLNVLSELGLKNKLDQELYPKACAQLSADFQAIQSGDSGSSSGGAQISEVHGRCRDLLCFFNDHFTDLYSKKLVDELANIAYVPVIRPTIDTSNTGHTCMMLVKWSEVALYKDRHLIWTHKPVLREDLEPPRQTWEHLGLSNRQHPNDVLQHLRNICSDAGGDSTGAMSPLFRHKDTPTDILSSILTYLYEKWDNFDRGQKDELSTLPMLPIHGTLLVKPSRTFFRMEVPLPPFLFEVPRAYGPHEEILKRLGTKEQPTIEDYVYFLNELKEEVGDQILNPNELNAVVRVVHMLIKEYARNDGTSSGMRRGMRFVVPDSEGRLAYHDECVVSLKHLKERLSNVVRACNRVLNVRDMITIGVPSIEDMVEERRVHSPTDVVDVNSGNDVYTDKGTNLPSVEISIDWTSKLRGSAALLASTCRMSADIVRSILSHTRIGFVQELHTRLYLKRNLGQHPMGTDCEKKKKKMPANVESLGFNNGEELDRTTTSVGCWIDWMYRQKNTETCIVLSRKVLDRHKGVVTTEQMISRCVMELLFELNGVSSGGDISSNSSDMLRLMSRLPTMSSMLYFQREHFNEGGLSPSGVVDTINNAAALDILRVHGIPTEDDSEIRRGVAGEQLLSHDASRVSYTPLHPYAQDEIIAVANSNNTTTNGTILDHTRIDRNALVYGHVLRSVSSENGLRRLQVRVRMDDGLHSTTVLSTSVFSFAPTIPETAYNSPTKNKRKSTKAALTAPVASNKNTYSMTSKSETKRGNSAPSSSASASASALDVNNRAVNSRELVDACAEILNSVGMPLKPDTQALMAETVELRRETKKQKIALKKLQNDNETFKDRLLCKICMVADVNRMLMPSGKMICSGCVGKITGVCPFTRKRVDSVIKLYF